MQLWGFNYVKYAVFMGYIKSGTYILPCFFINDILLEQHKSEIVKCVLV